MVAGDIFYIFLARKRTYFGNVFVLSFLLFSAGNGLSYNVSTFMTSKKMGMKYAHSVTP